MRPSRSLPGSPTPGEPAGAALKLDWEERGEGPEKVRQLSGGL